MKEFSKMCYEKQYCYFCNKKDCDKRLCECDVDNKVKTECNGDCYNCISAFSNLNLSNLLYFKSLGMSTKPCSMYKLIKNNSMRFYGVNTKFNNSKIECAIRQLEKCQICQDEKIFENLLVQIVEKIEKIPRCYESMTDLTSNKSLELVKYKIFEILNTNNYNCKVKTEVKRIIKEYISLNKESKVDLEKLCEYIISTKSNIDYYIHPLTVKIILLEIEKEEKQPYNCNL